MAESSEERYIRRLTNPDLRCRNKCGFYGNPIYQGYCSKCYKELVRDAPAQRTEDQGDSREGAASGFASFLRMDRKQKLISQAKGRKGKIFKGGPVRISPGAVPPDVKEGRKGKRSRSSDSFGEFLKMVKKPAAQDIQQHLKHIHNLIKEKKATIEEQRDMIQEFYTTMAEHLKTHPLFRTMGEEQQEEVMDGIEKHLMTSIQPHVFSPPSSDDEMKDLLLQRRIRMLHWLGPSHLDIALDLQNVEVQEMVSNGRQELWNMDEKKAPQDKLGCITRCCQHLLSALKISQNGPASADEFVPALIYMIIYTSPQRLHSNVNYISRFSNPMRLMSGEAGYYFTNLYAAISFIENLSGENLKMSDEEFNEKMGYVDGKTDVDLLLEEDDGVEDWERILVLKSCCQGMKELTDRLQLMLVEGRELETRMKEFRSGLRQQVDSILSSPPPRSLYTRPPETAPLIDLSDPTSSSHAGAQ